MKELFKKSLAVILVVVMTLTAAPLSGFVGLELPNWFGFKASAATYSGTCGDNLTWTFDEVTGELVIVGTGEMTNYSSSSVVPWPNALIKSISFPNGLTSIGDYAFVNLQSINSIDIPCTVKSIGLDSFNGSAVKEVYIPNGVETIGAGAFRYCVKLEKIFIGNTVNSIKRLAFDYCYNLRDVYYYGSEAEWKKISVGSSNSDLTSASIHYNYTPSVFVFGDGTESNPYQVSNPEQLNAVRNDLSAHYIQTADIDMSEWSNWKSIGGYVNVNVYDNESYETATNEYGSLLFLYEDSHYAEMYYSENGERYDENIQNYYALIPFSGVYDGNGYSIEHLKIDDNNDLRECFYGLFGASSGCIKNINMINIDYQLDGTETDFSKDISSPRLYVGGVVGYASSNCEIISSVVSGNISVENCHFVYVGGITSGSPYSPYEAITNCRNYADINVLSNRSGKDNYFSDVFCGGISATYARKIQQCSNYGNIDVNAIYADFVMVGGIVGEDGDIIECVNYGNLTGKLDFPTSSYTSSSTRRNVNVGGIVGHSSDNVEKCINYGNIYSSSYVKGTSCAGGICGSLGFSGAGVVTNSYNCSGNIFAVKFQDDGTNINTFSHSIVGYGYCPKNSFANENTLINGTKCIFDTQLDGLPLACDKLLDIKTYPEFDFQNIWEINTTVGGAILKIKDAFNSEETINGVNIPEDIVFIDKDEHYLFSAYDKNGDDITDKVNWGSATSVDCTGEVKITNNGDVQGIKEGLTNVHATYYELDNLDSLCSDSCYVFVGEPNEVKYTSVSDQIYYYGENAFYSDAADFSDSVDIYLSLENALNEQIDDLTEYDKYADELSALDIKGYTLTAKVSGSNLSFDKDEYINNYISAVDGKIPVGKAVDELLTLYPYNLDVSSGDKTFTVSIKIESEDFNTITDSFTFKISSLEDKEIHEHISFTNSNGVYKAMRDNDFATGMSDLKNDSQYIWSKYSTLDFENYHEVLMADILVQLMETQLVGNISLLPVLKEWNSNYNTILSSVSTIVEDSYAGSMEITDNLIDKVIKKSKYTTEGMDVHDEVRDLVVLKLRDKVSIDKINSAFAALDKTGQCLDLFDMGVNITNDIADWVDCVSIMNSYQNMNEEFKNVIQKVYDCIPNDDWKVKEAVDHYVKLDTTAGYTQEVIESVIELSKDITLEVFNSVFKKQFVSMFTKAVGSITLKSGALLSSTTAFSAISTGLGAISTGATLGLCISDILCNNSGQAEEMGKVVAASQLAPYVIQTLKYYEWALKNYKDESSLKHFETAFNLNRALQMYSIEHTYKALEVQANSLIIKLFSNKDYPGAMAELASLKTMHQNCNCCADVSTVVVRTKTIAIKCPVDVYVYDENGKEVVRIINDVAVYVEDGINVFINGREKYVTVPADQEYSVKIVAIDEGTMDYLVMEHDENGKYEVAFSNLNIELNSGKEFRGKICDEFNVVEDAYKISMVFNDELKINKTSTTKINFGDTLVLQLAEIELPNGYTVEWFVEGAGVSTSVSEDGLECRVTSIANGNATISAKLVDSEENVVTNADGEEIFDEITITSKAGFWQQLVSFFKNLFGINRVIY